MPWDIIGLPDGRLAVGTTRGDLYVWEYRDRFATEISERRVSLGSSQVSKLAPVESWGIAAVYGRRSPTVVVVGLDMMSQLTTIRHPEVTDIAPLSHGRLASSGAPWLEFWNLSDGPDKIAAASFSADSFAVGLGLVGKIITLPSGDLVCARSTTRSTTQLWLVDHQWGMHVSDESLDLIVITDRIMFRTARVRPWTAAIWAMLVSHHLHGFASLLLDVAMDGVPPSRSGQEDLAVAADLLSTSGDGLLAEALSGWLHPDRTMRHRIQNTLLWRLLERLERPDKTELSAVTELINLEIQARRAQGWL
jgi:hypothetical protein